MKKYTLIFLLLASNILSAQPFPMQKAAMDSLQNIINGKANDTNKIHAFYWLSRANMLLNTQKTLELANEGLDLTKKIDFPIGEIECLEALSFAYAITSSFDKGFKTAYQQMELSRKYAPIREVFGINMIGLLYQKLGDDKQSLDWAKKSYFHPQREKTDYFTQWSAKFLIAQEYERVNKLDSAYHFAQESLAYSEKYFPMQVGYPMLILARVNSKRKNFDEAINYSKQSILISKKTHSEFFVNEVENELAQIYFTQNKLDSAQHYASVALQGGNQFKNYFVIMNSSNLLSQIFEKSNPIKAFE